MQIPEANRVDKSDRGYNMVDDDEAVVLDHHGKVVALDLGDGQVVYCPVCETAVNRAGW
ncbi:hypothetical protein V1520DRAFT_347993 [Lipomyces starkeyi]